MAVVKLPPLTIESAASCDPGKSQNRESHDMRSIYIHITTTFYGLLVTMRVATINKARTRGTPGYINASTDKPPNYTARTTNYESVRTTRTYEPELNKNLSSFIPMTRTSRVLVHVMFYISRFRRSLLRFSRANLAILSSLHLVTIVIV